jgi:hypothetical protein
LPALLSLPGPAPGAKNDHGAPSSLCPLPATHLARPQAPPSLPSPWRRAPPDPETRGVALALQSVTDDLGRGLGPIIVAAFITSLGGRRNAFNLAISGWIPCGLITLSLACFMRRDEAAVQARLKKRSEKARLARRTLSFNSLEALAAAAAEEGRGSGGGGGGGTAEAAGLGIELEPCASSSSGGGAGSSSAGGSSGGGHRPGGGGGGGDAPAPQWRTSGDSGASGSGSTASAADSRTQLLAPRGARGSSGGAA